MLFIVISIYIETNGLNAEEKPR